MRLDLQTSYRTILVFATSTASALLIYFLLAPLSTTATNFHPSLYLALLFIGGFWTTSLAFKELHDQERNYIFLTLPGSNLEKFVNKLLLTSVGYVVMISVGYFLLSLVISTISKLLFNHVQPLFSLCHHDVLLYVKIYVVWQAVFLLGSVYFKKHVLSKVILSISCLVIVLIATIFVMTHLFFDPMAFVDRPFFSYMRWYGLFPDLMNIIFWWLLAPFCWAITYLRLTETELR